MRTNSSKTENMQKFQSAFTHPVFSTAKIRPARMMYTQNARPETPKPDFKMQHRTRNRIFTVSEVSQIMIVRENIFRHRLKLNQQWPQNRLIWSWLSVYILLEQSFGHSWNHIHHECHKIIVQFESHFQTFFTAFFLEEHFGPFPIVPKFAQNHT